MQKYKGRPFSPSRRKLNVQDAIRVQTRTSPDAMQMIAREMAERLNRHPDKELLKIVLPLAGLSSLSVEGGPMYDPDSDRAFIEDMEKCLDSHIEIVKVPNHINTREFAKAAVGALNRALRK